MRQEQGTGDKDPGLTDSDAVRNWVEGLRQQWGEEPADMADRIEVLRRFCESVERDPDVVIAECCREVEGGKRIRIKKRRFYSEKIDEVQASVDGDARAQARVGNIVRSFMIHNGIFMQGGMGGG